MVRRVGELMSVALEKIYYIAMRKYKMKLIAGKDGLDSNVSWLHIVEEIKYASFLTGGELVLYTGVKAGTNNLLSFVKEIRKYKASGLVINIGEYIGEVPQEIIDYANENDFPIFTLPWEVHLVEISREFGSMIIRSEEYDKNLCAAFKTAIFSPDDKSEYIPVLKKNNMLLKKYCLIKCKPEIDYSNGAKLDVTKIFYDLREIFSRVLNQYRENYVVFRHEKYLTMIIPELNKAECHKIINNIKSATKAVNHITSIYYAVSRFNVDIEDMHRDYNNLSSIIKLMKRENKDISYIDELGLINIIFAAENNNSLLQYKTDTIGKLEKHDIENGTNYIGILRSYLDNDCNMNEAAKDFYLHRNTFAYHLNKISELLKVDLYSTNDRTKLFMALIIKEVYEL